MTDLSTRPCTPTTAGCGCGGTSRCGCGSAGPVGLERPRWFAGQLVGPDDLTQEQRYVRDKLRRHNRLLHGWGVVCGVEVGQAKDAAKQPVSYTVTVRPGYVLGPYGDEIVVDDAVTLDVRTRNVTGESFSPCGPSSDPWCADVHIIIDPLSTWYLAIRYDECLTRPVRSPSACGCGSNGDGCEYSRIRDSYALAILEELPAVYVEAATPPIDVAAGGMAAAGSPLREVLAPCGRACPPCPEEPWVVLADLTIGGDGLVTVDDHAHRRYAASFGGYGSFCTQPT